MRHTHTLAPVFFCLTGAFLAAQKPPAQSLFRAGTDLVVVDFLAVDANAQPVADLTAKDFVLTVDGRPREIRALQFVKVSHTSTEAPIPAPALPPPFGTNDASVPGRTVLIVVDHEQIRPVEGKPVFDAAVSFLDRLSPVDRIGVVTLPNGNIEADLTTNHERVRSALGRIVGRAAQRQDGWNISPSEAIAIEEETFKSDKPVTNAVVTRECGARADCAKPVISAAVRYAREVESTTRGSLVALRVFFEGLAQIEGPKSMLFLSGSLISTSTTPFDLEDVARAAALARAQLYVLQPNQPLVDATSRGTSQTVVNDMDLRARGLADLAANAGGVFVRLSGSGENIFTRIADEISAYYVLGFSPQSSEHDGKGHRIELKTSRPQVTVRARPTFVIGGSKNAEPTPPPEPRTMLRDYGSYRDLPLRVAAYPFRDSGSSNVKIIVALEPVEPGVTLNTAAFALIDLKGRSGAEWTEDGVGVILRPLITAAAVPPGEYRLRVAAVDTSGRRGAVDFEFPARLTEAGAFRIGAIMLGALDRGVFKPSLLTDGRSADVTSYTELYGAPEQRAALSAVYELTARPDGPAIAVAKATVLETREPDRLIATAALPLATAAPGDYVVRLIVSLDGKEIGRVSRTLRKSGS